MITIGGLHPVPLDLTLERLLAHDPSHPLVVNLVPLAPKPHHFAPPLETAKLLAVIGDESSFLRCAVYSTAFFKSSFSIVNLPTIRSSSAMRAKDRFSLCDGPSAKPV